MCERGCYFNIFSVTRADFGSIRYFGCPLTYGKFLRLRDFQEIYRRPGKRLARSGAGAILRAQSIARLKQVATDWHSQ
jgi:hypothetical protein